MSGDAVESPELARELIQSLALAGIDPELVPPSLLAEARVESSDDGSLAGAELRLRGMRYRAVVVPGVVHLRASTADVLQRFADAGGLVVTVSRRPKGTEQRDFDAEELANWVQVAPMELVELLRRVVQLDVATGADSIMSAHRRLTDGELFLIVNSATAPQSLDVALCSPAGFKRVERWDPWSGRARGISAHARPTSVSVPLRLEPGESALLALVRGEPAVVPEIAAGTAEAIHLDGPWMFDLCPSLDNRFGDFEVGNLPVGVPSWRVEEAPAESGPWTPAQVDAPTRFFVLGPVPPTFRDEVDLAVSRLRVLRLTDVVRFGELALTWRPYRFSESSGIVGDPLLLDRMTGPHGLKGVPDEFLDPTVLDQDARPGDSYYFWSSVTDGEGTHLVHSSGRAEHAVWFDGKLVIDRAREVEAAFYPPWGLRDMSSSTMAVTAEAGTERPPLTVRINVAHEQPTRVAVWVGGTVPPVREPALLRWWQGSEPAFTFEPAIAGGRTEVWLRALVPPGAHSVTFEVVGTVTQMAVSGSTIAPVALSQAAEQSRYEVSIPPSDSDAVRTLTWAVTHTQTGSADAGALRGPLRWTTAPHPVTLLPWPALGLGDYSGLARYTTRFTIPPSIPFLYLRLGGLAGTARVEVNGTVVGDIVEAGTALRVEGALLAEQNTLTVEVANTLSNFFAHLPSPYGAMQAPSGGFTSAWLELGRF